MNFRRFPARALAAVVVTMTIGVAAEADPIPQDWLTNVKNGCLKTCAAQQLPAATCETACSCVEQETAATMDKDEFVAANTAVSSNQAVSPELTAKAQAIEDRCRPAQ